MRSRWAIPMTVLLIPAMAAMLWAQATAEPSPAPAPTPAPEPATAPAPTPADSSPAAHTMAGLLTAMPRQTQSFVAITDLADVATKMAAFTRRTSIPLPIEQPSITELLRLKTLVQAGLAPRGAAAVVYLDAETFKDRNTLFLLPVGAPETFLEYTSGREIETGLYQIAGEQDARFLSFRDRYAIFSTSLRTSRAVRDGQFGEPPDLTEEQLRTARTSDVYAHIDLQRTLASRKESSDRFRKSVASKILGDPTLQSYSDLLLGYMAAVNEVFEQLDGFDLGLTFGTDDLGVSLIVKFADGGSIFQALQNLSGPETSALRWLPLDRPFVSSGSLSLNPEALRSAVTRMVDFVMPSSPQSQKSVQQKTREDTIRSVGDLMAQVTGEMAAMTALPDPASGAAEAGVVVFGIRDKQKFAAAREAVSGNLLRVGTEVGTRVTLSYLNRQEEYRGVVIDYVRPSIAFTSKQYERLFKERAEKVYGPDGFLYRLALMDDRLIVCSGSDLRLFHAAIDLALDARTVPALPEMERVRRTLPAKRNVEYYFNLSAVLSRSLSLAGATQGAASGPITLTDEDRKFLADQTMIGLAIGLDQGRIRADSHLGYDQLANAMAFLQRHLPSMTPPPPTTEEPKSAPPKVTPEPPAQPAPPPTTEPPK